ncbi:transfer repressor [Salmonella enterica]|nr:transfer repressor [Salmonella enterica]EEX1006178.1 transfer repressor [Escherichia coli]
MLLRNTLIHGLRRDQLIEVLDISEFPVVHVDNPFVQPESTGIKPVIFNIDELHVAITPISSLNFDWEWAPVDTILIEVIIPPVAIDLVDKENTFLRTSGIGHIQCEPGGASIRRTVTFVGGITADNLLYQLRLMCVSALHLLGEELEDEQEC